MDLRIDPDSTRVAQAEGVINFAYYLQTSSHAVAPTDLTAPLNAWRTIFRRLGIVGQDAERYGGFAFGNLSARDVERPDEFVITASQTGAVPDLHDHQFVRITGFNIDRFWVDAIGSQPPSSETLTHAMVYATDARIRWVFHCHSPEIWSRAETLAVPCIESQVTYGTPEMAGAVSALLQQHQSRPILFVTQGHQDGVFACGPTARDTGGLLVSYLAKALV